MTKPLNVIVASTVVFQVVFAAVTTNALAAVCERGTHWTLFTLPQARLGYHVLLATVVGIVVVNAAVLHRWNQERLWREAAANAARAPRD
jgi:hypothetical protein